MASPSVPPTASPLPAGATVVTLLGVLGGFVVVLGLTVVLLLLVPMSDDTGLLVLTAALTVASLLAVLVVGTALRRRDLGWRDLGFVPPTRRLLHLLWQLPAVLLVLVVVQLASFLVFLDGPPPESRDGRLATAFADASPGVLALLVLAVVVLTPVWEEAVFRGLVYGGLRRRVGVAVAGGGSALLFAAAHAVPPLLPYFLTFGIACVLLREFHRTLWAPVLAHALVNGLATATVLVGSGS